MDSKCPGQSAWTFGLNWDFGVVCTLGIDPTRGSVQMTYFFVIFAQKQRQFQRVPTRYVLVQKLKKNVLL